LIAAHLGETPPPPRSLNPSIPEAMEALVSRMMAKEPSARPSMRDAAHALGEFSSIEPSVPPVSLGPSNAPAASRDNGPTQSIFLQSSPDQPSTAGARSDEKRVSAGGVSAPGVASTRHPPFKLSRPVAFVSWGILGFATIVYAAVLRFTRVEPPAAPTVLTQPVQTAAESSAAPAPASAAAVASAPEPPPAESAPPATEAAASVELPAPSTETIAKTSAAAAKAPGIERLDAVKPIRVTIANARPGLRIEVDGRESSFPLVLPRDKKTHLLVFSTRNFKPESRKIVADRDQSIVLENRPRQLYVP
jgi:serine/threonine-protein kinase